MTRQGPQAKEHKPVLPVVGLPSLGGSRFGGGSISAKENNMKVSFTLSMPNRGSWNGGWSGSERVFAIVKDFAPTKAPEEGSHYYDFGDGWGASVLVRHIDAKTARVLKKKSAGFCGYDWMVDSIVWYGKIMNNAQKKDHLESISKAKGS